MRLTVCAISPGSQSLASDKSLKVFTVSMGIHPELFALQRTNTSSSEGKRKLSLHHRHDSFVSMESLSPTV